MSPSGAFAVRAETGDRVWRLATDLSVSARAGSLIAGAVEEVFGAMEVGAGERCHTHLDLDLGPAPGGALRLVVNGVPIVRIAEESALAPTLEGTLVGYAVRTRRACAALHAASVVIDGRATILLGDKGSGKSTLSSWLASEGAEYFGDEITFLHFSNLHIEPFPKAATLKEGAFSLFPETTTHLDPIRGPVRYFIPRSAGTAGADRVHVPEVIILPRITPGIEEVRVVELSPAEMALHLVKGSFGGLERDPRMLRVVAKLAELPSFGIEYPDVRAGAAAVIELVSRMES